MRFSISILGTEILAVELGSPDVREPADHTVAHRHAGEFGFGASPVRPYWSATRGDEPDVARTRAEEGL